MKIQELENRKIKIGKTSITVVGDDGKTAGVVRNVKTWATMQPRDTFPIRKQIKSIFAAGKADRLILDGKNWYYVYNAHIGNLIKYKPAFVDLLQDSINKEKEVERLAIENGIAVIHAEILM